MSPSANGEKVSQPQVVAGAEASIAEAHDKPKPLITASYTNADYRNRKNQAWWLVRLSVIPAVDKLIPVLSNLKKTEGTSDAAQALVDDALDIVRNLAAAGSAMIDAEALLAGGEPEYLTSPHASADEYNQCATDAVRRITGQTYELYKLVQQEGIHCKGPGDEWYRSSFTPCSDVLFSTHTALLQLHATQDWSEVLKVTELDAIIQGVKQKAHHIADGLIMRREHIERCFVEASIFEIASRKQNTSTTKKTDADAAFSRLLELVKEAFWPADSLSTIINPVGTGGAATLAFHDVRARRAIEFMQFVVENRIAAARAVDLHLSHNDFDWKSLKENCKGQSSEGIFLKAIRAKSRKVLHSWLLERTPFKDHFEAYKKEVSSAKRSLIEGGCEATPGSSPGQQHGHENTPRTGRGSRKRSANTPTGRRELDIEQIVEEYLAKRFKDAPHGSE